MIKSSLGQAEYKPSSKITPWRDTLELVVVILNWNAAEDTLQCIRRLLAWSTLRPEIIVVDNASTDNSVEIIAAEYPQVCLICNPVNLGFSGGNNRGIEAALSKGNAPILLLNNDAFIAEEDMSRLLETLHIQEGVGLVGPLLFDAAQPDRLLAAGSKDPSQHHHSHNHKLLDNRPLQVVECIPGTAILGRAELFRTVGLLDENYFFSAEIADLCLRARQADFLSVINTQAKAFHALGRSSKFRDILYPYYIIRNRFLLIRKFHKQWLLLFFSFWTFYSLLLALKVQLSGKRAMARAIRLGLLDGLRGRFGGQNERVLAFSKGPRISAS